MSFLVGEMLKIVKTDMLKNDGLENPLVIANRWDNQKPSILHHSGGRAGKNLHRGGWTTEVPAAPLWPQLLSEVK